MKLRAMVIGAALFAAGTTAASAALTEAQFPPGTVADLIAICGPAKDDPLMTAAVNFCHGFAEGAVLVEQAHDSWQGARKLFCLPDPRPPRGSELTSFIAWANEKPARLSMGSVDGMFVY